MRLVLTTVTAVLATIALPQLPAAAAVAPTVEESRLSGSVPQSILQRSGFASHGPALATALAQTTTLAQATAAVTAAGRTLWQNAVDRAQGRNVTGDLPINDDRPLYWARLAMSSALRQWQPGYALTTANRDALQATLERSSRGQDTLNLPTVAGTRRVIVTGFDPFSLDGDPRNSNPSGAIALSLDGITVTTATGPARIETATFPVRWDDFTAGMVEHTLTPYFQPGPQRVDAFMTISQGRAGRFDIEHYNGAYRGSAVDNNNRTSSTNLIPIPADVPTVTPQPTRITSTLPFQRMIAAKTSPFPVYDNTTIVSGNGTGGNYLSNEIAYRATLLRDATALTVMGGHLHTPILSYGGSTTDITSPTFASDRATIMSQSQALLIAALGQPTATPSATATPTATASVTAKASPTASPTPSPSASTRVSTPSPTPTSPAKPPARRCWWFFCF